MFACTRSIEDQGSQNYRIVGLVNLQAPHYIDELFTADRFHEKDIFIVVL